jgi:hypothetical protein
LGIRQNLVALLLAFPLAYILFYWVVKLLLRVVIRKQWRDKNKGEWK